MKLSIIFIIILFNLINVNAFDYFGFLPEYKGSITNTQEVEFDSPCFNGKIYYNEKTVSFDLNKKKILCSDTFIIANNYRIYLKNYFFEGIHTINLNNITTNEEREIDYYGINIYWLKNGMFESTGNLLYTLNLFVGDNIEKNNLNFIKQKMDHEYTLWNNTIDFPEEYINSGDLFAITRLDGVDPLIMWGTGSFMGHTAIALRINETLYICESTDKNPVGESYWPPPYGIIKTPYIKWIKLAKKAEYIVSILRLNNANQKLFDQNIENIIENFNQLEGLPYGYRNFFFSWIDTLNNNFPPDLSKELFINIISTLQRINTTKKEVSRFINEALNKRLGTKGLSFIEIIEKTVTLNKSIYDLLTIPEDDNWVYSDGKSLVCDTFVLELYKIAGIFGKFSKDIHITEFTPKDAYQLEIFNDSWKPGICINDEIFCQIMGKYKMVLPDTNTIQIYPNMNEKCNSIPPQYIRNGNC